MLEHGMRAGCAGRAANTDWLMLREGGLHPRDIVPLVLSGARPEVEDMGPQEGADDGLLKGGDDARVDSGVYKVILDFVESVGKDEVGPCDAHVACDSCQGLICVLGQ